MIRRILSLFLLTVAAGHAADTKATAKVEVAFINPENFTDLRDSYFPSEKGSKALLTALQSYLQEAAGKFVPDGCKLTLSFTDIDLAGEFEPWRGADATDIRVYRDIYPPRFKFSWNMTDSSGRVLKAGVEDIQELNYMMKAGVAHEDDRLDFDKGVLGDWIRDSLRGIAKPVEAE